jgi:uncharacterized protein (TIGR02099 family)
MPTALRRHFRRARRAAWYTLAVVLVVMALVAGVVSQLLPLAERHPDRIAAWLSARAHRPVQFDHVATQWTRRGPLLRLDGLRIGSGADTLQIGAAEILISQYAGLLPGRSFTELRLRGLDLALQRGDDGHWRVRGLPGGQRSESDPFGQLEGLGELQVIGGKLRIDAPALGIDARIPDIDLRLRVDGPRVRIGARARMRGDGTPIEGSLDFDRRSGDGRGHLLADDVRVSEWTPLLRGVGVAPERGDGRIEAWSELRARRVTAVVVDARLRDLRLRGAPLAGRANAPQADLGAAELQGRWRSVAGGWRFDAAKFRISAGDAAQRLDGLAIGGGQRHALRAAQVDVGPLLALAALSDRVPLNLRAFLLDARPQATLRDVEFATGAGGALRAKARIENLRYAAHGTEPGVGGLSGTLDGDEHGVAFDFDPASTLRFDWPPGFGAPHDVHVRGTVAGWRDGAGWRVETAGLRIAGIGYGADLRGGLWFQGDGTRPWIDLAARLDDTAVPVAKRFWVRHRMSPNSVHWLDTALLGGRVLDGRAVVSGDLDDWPFRAEPGQAARGLFEADARLDGAIVKFQSEWPQADHIDGDVSFVADGFTVKGRGAIAGVVLPKLEGGIPRFAHAELGVRADVAGDAATLLALLKQSPLHKAHADTLDNLTASGPTRATFALDLPLHAAASVPTLGGTIDLDGVKLGETRWKLAFADVRGNARYDHDGFDADNLQAVQDGAPGRLSLRAGPGHVNDATQAFEAELGMAMDADALLDRAPEMAWLKPRAQGRSAWTVAVTIPKTETAAGQAAAAETAHLQLRSDLVGTRLDLPAPLDKTASVALPTRIDTRLPFGQGDIAVAFGKRLALRARSANGRTGVRVVLGSDHVSDAAPASGLVASGRTHALDALDWALLTAGGEGEGVPLQRIDISADRLQLLGASFPDVHVTATPNAGGTAVRIDGAKLAGALSLPRATGAAIVGDFQRLYWTSAQAAAGTATAANANAGNGDAAPAASPAADAAADAVDPAKIPPLQLSIADLRFGDSVLGQTTLRTQPVAGGLRIEQLQTRAAKQRVDAGGDWLGRGASARTRLHADVASEDFGGLLAGFGFGGRIAGGRGTAKLDAAWPGSPAGFKAGALQGALALDMKDGQLVQVDPGAGRVLGLLSVAQLPRRLMLDFRDFFSKGFAFNRIAGNVRFGGGQARSDDMRIDGPAAEIRIRGAADLRAQTFDQTIEVSPKSGNLLTVAGAIAGGPIGAAVGAVANAVLRKPLGEVGAKTYRVTGPWKEPKVEVQEHASSRTAAPAPAQ